MSELSNIIAVLAIFCVLAIAIPYYLTKQEDEATKEKITALADSTIEMTPKEFFDMRHKAYSHKNNPDVYSSYYIQGVYILYNSTKNMYYVGQGIHVFDRVNSHFTGKGNGDVYADYKYGDQFTIRIISLEKSGISSLNELERKTIATYDAFSKGYNKTRGNRNRSSGQGLRSSDRRITRIKLPGCS